MTRTESGGTLKGKKSWCRDTSAAEGWTPDQGNTV